MRNEILSVPRWATLYSIFRTMQFIERSRKTSPAGPRGKRRVIQRGTAPCSGESGLPAGNNPALEVFPKRFCDGNDEIVHDIPLPDKTASLIGILAGGELTALESLRKGQGVVVPSVVLVHPNLLNGAGHPAANILSRPARKLNRNSRTSAIWWSRERY